MSPSSIRGGEIGWIFRDGNCIAIERQGDETRARSLGE